MAGLKILWQISSSLALNGSDPFNENGMILQPSGNEASGMKLHFYQGLGVRGMEGRRGHYLES